MFCCYSRIIFHLFYFYFSNSYKRHDTLQELISQCRKVSCVFSQQARSFFWTLCNYWRLSCSDLFESSERRSQITAVVFGQDESQLLVWTMYFCWHQTVFSPLAVLVFPGDILPSESHVPSLPYTIHLKVKKHKTKSNNFPIMWHRDSWKSLQPLLYFPVRRGRRRAASAFQHCCP